MKKSRQVPAALIASMATGLAVSGCSSSPPVYECRDAYGRMLPYSACQGSAIAPGAHWVQTGGFGGGSGGVFGG